MLITQIVQSRRHYLKVYHLFIAMIVLSLGANIPSLWGTPYETLRHTLITLEKSNIRIIGLSKLYHTTPYGIDTQNIFLNAIILVNSSLSAPALFQICRQIERDAGRKHARKWQSRPLDVDIVDYKRRVCNWNLNKPWFSRGLILPHPHAHKRAFVLKPLADVAPFWHHPVYGVTASHLLTLPDVRQTGAILHEATEVLSV